MNKLKNKNRKKISILLLFSICLSFVAPFMIYGNASDETFDDSDAIPVLNQMAISHGRTQYEYHANNLANLNPKLCRGNIMWFDCARQYGKEDGRFNFSVYDDIYGNMISRGIEPLGSFVYGWGWWPNSYEVPREDWPYYFHFVEEFVKHFNETLTYYEMWNEPNIGFWPGSDADFFEFVENITLIVKEFDSTSIILSPGVAGPEIEWIEKMFDHFGDKGFSELFDVFSYHAYNGNSAEKITQKMEYVKRLLENHNFNGQVWITETGLSTAVSTEEQSETFMDEWWDFQATQVIKIYSQGFDYNISSMFWYCLNDWCDTNDTVGEGRFGLMYCSDSEEGLYDYKPSGYAYQTLSNLINGGTFYPNGIELKSPSGGKIWAYYFYSERNTTIVTLWSQNFANNAKFSLIAPEGYSEENVDFEIINYDYLHNSSSKINDGNNYNFELGNTPYVFEINYTKSLSQDGIEAQPLTLVINVNYSWDHWLLILLVPIPGLIGIIILIKQKIGGR